MDIVSIRYVVEGVLVGLYVVGLIVLWIVLGYALSHQDDVKLPWKKEERKAKKKAEKLAKKQAEQERKRWEEIYAKYAD